MNVPASRPSAPTPTPSPLPLFPEATAVMSNNHPSPLAASETIKNRTPSALLHHWGSHWGADQSKSKGNKRSKHESSHSLNSDSTKNPNKNNSHHHNNATSSTIACQRTKRVIYCRILVVSILCIVASGLGVAAYRLLSKSEQTLAETQFDSITQRALLEASEIAHQRRWAGVTMANMVSELYPNASQWPFIEFWGFERLAHELLRASRSVDMGISPYVYPHQQAEWEQFAYGVYHELGWPNTTGRSPDFSGIWGVDHNSTELSPYDRYHETGNGTTWGSPYTMKTPVFRTDEGAHPILLYDPHTEEKRGTAIDIMTKCAEEEALENRQNWTLHHAIVGQESRCGIATEMIRVVKHDGRHGMAMFHPIFSRDDPPTMVGLISTLMLVDELLENAFGNVLCGIDAVFETETQAVTFTIVNGVSQLVGEGDLHDSKYDKYEQSIVLTDGKLFVKQSPTYTLHFYPNEEFFEVYETGNPRYASFGSVCIIIITSMCFFLYDFCVRREFHAKQELLQARRQFMRFVSHEVRTPLNSICMGLELVQAELARSLGYPTAESAKTARQQYTTSVGDIDNHEENGGDSPLADSRQRELEWFALTEEIQSNAEGAIDILNDLLNYDKIEQGNLQLEECLVAIWDLLEKSMLEFKLPAASKKIDLDVSFWIQTSGGSKDELCNTSPHELPHNVRKLKLLGDPVRIAQVLRNLMSNALKFTPEGGKVHIKTIYVPDANDKYAGKTVYLNNNSTDVAEQATMLHSSGKLKIVVTDTGAGMSEGQIAKLFRDGVQFNVNQLQAGQGSGLGLFIAKGIVEQHEGTVTASSKGLGQGTSFQVTLPLWAIPENTTSHEALGGDDAETKIRDFAHIATTSSKNHLMRILVVDDVQSNRKLLSRLLENAGHTCEGVGSGQEAVELVYKSMLDGCPYSCVMMDYEMPGMDGPTASKEIRNLGSDVFIIGVTGNVLPEDVSYFKLCGANDVLSKPVKLTDIEYTWMEHGIYEVD